MRGKVDRKAFAFKLRTHSVEVTAQPFFLEEHSVPEDRHFVWAYKIKIENQSANTLKLLTRHWLITDGNGCMREVRGEGVIGEQPVLRPGESFEYSSFATLPTNSGLMTGTYEMRSDQGSRVDIEVPPFSLDSPGQLSAPN